MATSRLSLFPFVSLFYDSSLKSVIVSSMYVQYVQVKLFTQAETILRFMTLIWFVPCSATSLVQEGDILDLWSGEHDRVLSWQQGSSIRGRYEHRGGPLLVKDRQRFRYCPDDRGSLHVGLLRIRGSLGMHLSRTVDVYIGHQSLENHIVQSSVIWTVLNFPDL